MDQRQILKCRLTAELLANIYSHVHEDTEEKVRRAALIAEEILNQVGDSSEQAEKEKAPESCL